MGTPEPLNNPLYKNWVRATVGCLYGKRAIIPYIQKVVDDFKTNIFSVKPSPQPCNQCTIVNFRLTNCPTGVCEDIYDAIKEDHRFNKPTWDNADTSRWCFNSWEMAKCFMPKSNEMKDVKSIYETDLAGIANLVIHSRFVQGKLAGTPPPRVFVEVSHLIFSVITFPFYSIIFQVYKTKVLSCYKVRLFQPGT